VGQEVADAGPAALLGGQQQAVLAGVGADLEAGAGEVGLGGLAGGGQGVQPGVVLELGQGALAGALAEAAHVAQHRAGLADDAGAGGQHQEAEDGQEPEL
jgi:hypothetical protein